MGSCFGNGGGPKSTDETEDVQRDDSAVSERRNRDPRLANRHPITVNREREQPRP
jgi:hypothetical protein